MITPRRDVQRIVPMLAYNDAGAAAAFLCRAFGFHELYRLPMSDGRIGHCELAFRGNVVYVASAYPELGMRSPKDLPALAVRLAVEVEDVDAHCAIARAAGAAIVLEPADQFYGERTYHALDLEGHRWIFRQHIRDVSVEEMLRHTRGGARSA